MSRRPVAVIVAMDAELVHLVGDLSRLSGHVGGRPRYDLTIGDRAVVAVRSGMGMLNAASTTERVVAELAPAAILNYGCAGAHLVDILPGDLVLAERVVYHAAVNILRDGSERHTGFGYEVAGEAMQSADLAADPGWLAAARLAAERHPIEPWPIDLRWPDGVTRGEPLLHAGTVASADVWTQDVRRLAVLAERHGSLCEDMEAAAVAHVARLHRVPFLSVKDISNNEHHAPSDLASFTDFPIAEVGKRAAALLTATIEQWSKTDAPG